MNASVGEHENVQKQATTKPQESGCEVRLQPMKLRGNALAKSKGYLAMLWALRHRRCECPRCPAHREQDVVRIRSAAYVAAKFIHHDR